LPINRRDGRFRERVAVLQTRIDEFPANDQQVRQTQLANLEAPSGQPFVLLEPWQHVALQRLGGRESQRECGTGRAGAKIQFRDNGTSFQFRPTFASGARRDLLLA